MNFPNIALIKRRCLAPKAPLAALLWLAGCCASASAAVDQTYKYFRFSPTAFRDSGENSVQISEIVFYKKGVAVPRSGAVVTNPNGNSPTAEPPTKAFDNDPNSKWLDFNKQPLVFEFPSATTIDAYNFITGNDELGRDPISWKLEGSSDGNRWDLLDVVNNHATPTARSVYATKTSTGFALPGVAIPSFTASKVIVLNGRSVSLNWQTFLATSASIDHGVGPVSANGSTTVVPPAGETTTYTLTAGNGTETVTRTVEVRSVAGGVSNFQYVRFSPKTVRGGPIGEIQLSELRFRNNGTTLVPVSVTNPGGNNPNNEGPDKLSDGLTTTKWLNTNAAPLVFNFGTPVDFNSYYLSTGNDATERDPLRWTIEGSNDLGTWTLIDNVTHFDYATPAARQTQSDGIPLPGPSLTPINQLDWSPAPGNVPGAPSVSQTTGTTSSAQAQKEVFGVAQP